MKPEPLIRSWLCCRMNSCEKPQRHTFAPSMPAARRTNPPMRSRHAATSRRQPARQGNRGVMDTSDRGDEALGAHAAQRAAELQRRQTELETHQSSNPEDVELAARRAHEAHEWARKAELGAAAAFEAAANLHEEAARLHDLSIQHRHGDPAAHHDAARRHREAAQEDRANAERKRREAEHE